MLSGDGERRGGGRGGPPGERGDREGGYRRRFGDRDGGKEGGAPGEFQPQLYVFPLSPASKHGLEAPGFLAQSEYGDILADECVIAVVDLVVDVVPLLQLKCWLYPYPLPSFYLPAPFPFLLARILPFLSRLNISQF